MKFVASQQELSNALQAVTMALQSRGLVRILENVMIKAQDDIIELTGSDSTTEVSYNIEGIVTEAGQSTLKGATFEDIVRKMPEADITVSADEKNMFTISCGRIKTRLSGDSADEYPRKSSAEITSEVSMPGDAFCELIANTEACISKDPTRYILTGGCLDVEGTTISMVALDGFRMALKQYSSQNVTKETRVVIPAKALGILKKLLPGIGDREITMRFSEKDFELSFESVTIKCSLISGEYPKWKMLLPKNHDTIVRLDARVFKNAIDRAAIIARISANKLIKLSVAPNTLTISANGGSDDILESIDVETTGNSLDISFNVLYLADAVRMFPDGDVYLHFTKPYSPCIISGKENDYSFCWMVLPVRI